MAAAATRNGQGDRTRTALVETCIANAVQKVGQLSVAAASSKSRRRRSYTIAEVRSVQDCSHRASFGPWALRTLSAALALKKIVECAR
jgi:hypothetical protein